MKNIYEHVYNYPTKHPKGFIGTEIEELLKSYPTVNKEKFFDALRGNTCMIFEGQIVTYHCDIAKAIECGLENRNLTAEEWD